MIFAISKFIANLFGLDLQKVQKWVLIAVIGLGFIVFLALGLWLKSCFTKPPKLDEAEIQKGEQAVKERNDKVLRDILTNSDAREHEIAANVAQAEANSQRVIEESREKYGNMNTSELAAELERRK